MMIRNLKFTRIQFWILNFSFILGLSLLLNSYSVSAEDFSDNIEKAISIYEKGDFKKAIQELKQVISVLKDSAEDEPRNEGLFKANLYLGMSYLGVGEESLAKESFRNAIKMAPYKTLNPELFPPKVISLYNEVIAQSLSSLTVQSNVLGAEVFIDNIKKGSTPVVARNLLPGVHILKVMAAGQEHIKSISLEPGKETSITVDFQNTGSINVTSEPSSVMLYLDGNATGMTPLLIKDVPSGEHLLSASKEGYIESNMKVTAKVNEVIEKHFKLMPIVYTVRIFSVPEDAKVFWDETPKGATPVTIDNTAAGVHKIRITKEDYEELLDTIDVKAPSTEKTYLLNPYKGNLSIKTEPSGVEVIMNDRNVGLTPLNINELQVKQYTVKLKKEGYMEKNIVVNITKDKTAEIKETLLEIDTQPPNIMFKPINTAIKENKNIIRATVSDNKSVKEVALMLKMEGLMNFHRVDMSNTMKGIYEAVIPDAYLKKGSVLKYYIVACDMQDNCTTEGTRNLPYELKVSSLEPYTEGFVLDVRWEGDNAQVIISLGSEEGVKKGDTYIVFRTGKELRDPKTGDLLQVEEMFVGTIKVRELMPNTAYATVDSSVVPIVKNDRIRKVPSTPSGVLTEGSHATKIILRWAPNREPEVEGYRIFRSSTIDGNYKKIGQTNGRDNTFYEDTDDMREGLTFYYKITAFNILGADSLMSEPIVGKTKKVGPPPENIKVEGMKVREVHLRWDIIKQDPDIKSYVIYRADGEGGQFEKIANVDRDTETYIDRENLKDGKIYFYKIAVKSRHGSIGELSSAVKAKTKDVPAPPQEVGAVSGMARMVKVQWDKHTDTDVEGYIVYRKEGDTFTKIAKTEKTEFLDKDVSDGTIYYYSVSSFYYVRGMEIIGPSSQPVSAETKDRPKAPVNVSAEGGLARKIDLKWNKNEEKDIVEYWVYRGTEDKLDRSPFSKVNTNTFTDTNLKDNAKYYYAVKAVDVDGLESDLSNIVSGITKSLPKPPTGLDGQASQGMIYLKWKPNEEKDIKGYNIYKKGWLLVKDTLLTTSDRNSCEIKIKEKMKSITLYITAIDKDDLESEPSEEIDIIFQ